MKLLHNDDLVLLLAFTGSAAAVVAQVDSVPTWLRVASAAYSAGCAASLAILRRPGQRGTKRAEGSTVRKRKSGPVRRSPTPPTPSRSGPTIPHGGSDP